MSTYVNEVVESIWSLIRFAYGADIKMSFDGVVAKLVVAPAEVRDTHLRLVSNKLTAMASCDDDYIDAAFAYSTIVDKVRKSRSLYWRAVALQKKAVASTEAALCAAARKGDFRQVFHLAEKVGHLTHELDRALGR